MAPQKRKGGQSGALKADDAAKSSPRTSEEATAKQKNRFVDFLPGGAHSTKIQFGVMFFVAAGSLVNFYINPPDQSKFTESYRAPLRWYDHYAITYETKMTSWGYTLPTVVVERLHALHKEAGLDLHKARVLDVGAGGGLVGRKLHHLAYHFLIGLDISPKMAADQNSTGPYEQFVTADAETIPIEALKNEDGSLDTVLCIGTAGYLARGLRGGEQDFGRQLDGKEYPPEAIRVRRLFEEWLRVLKPGGIVGLTVESHLAVVWEAEQKKLVASKRWDLIEAHDGLSFLPKHMDKQIQETRVRLYFHRKLP